MDRTQRPRRGHGRRNAALGALGVLAALAVAAAICEIVEWPFLRHPLERKLGRILDRRVAFGDRFGVRLLGSVRAHTDSMTIGPAPADGPTLVDDAGKPRDFMHANAVRLALSSLRMEMAEALRRLMAPCISGTKANCGTKITAAIRVIHRSIWII